MPVDEFGREIPAPSGRSDSHYGPASSSSYHAPPPDSADRYHHSRRGPSLRGPPPPPPSRRGGRGPRRPPPPSSHSKRSTDPHPSTRYVTTPLLCGYLWKQQQRDDKQSKDEDTEKEETTGPNDAEETAESADEAVAAPHAEEEDQAYTEYRRSYCASYLQHVFNAHLDDSWFRQLFSPLGRYEAALRERQRAQQEAAYLAEELQQQREKHPDTWTTSLSLTAPPDSSPSAPPSWHVPRAVQEGRVLQVSHVPSYVTDSQLWHALPPVNTWWTPPEKSSTTPATLQATDLLQLWSSVPTQTQHNRTVYWLAPTARDAQALWQAFQTLDGRSASSSTDTSVPWEVDCPDPYRRTEYDVDGRGTAPEDGLGVPDRVAVLAVRPYTDTTTVNVLSTALSQPTRLASDARAATTLARALDVQAHVPTAVQLDALLESAALFDDASRLDLALAYLRRVHHVNFYKGCVRASSWANILAGQEAASSVQYRAHVSPEEAQDENITTAEGEEPVDKAEGKDKKDEEEANDDNFETTATPEALAKAMGSPARKDLLVQRLDDAIQQALTVACDAWIAAAPYVVDKATDAAAEKLRNAEAEAEETWLRHHSIDDEGRARCSFHFCHKLFKDENFLRKHLKKKHFEYCQAEQAKCHDKYMMKAWEGAGASRPRAHGETGTPRLIVPDILVDCGTKYGCIPVPLYHVPKDETKSDEDDENDEGVIVDVVDPEPGLWQKEQEEERLAREKRQAVEEMRARRREESRQQRAQQPMAPRKDKFVDVDDMKEEEVVTMTFDKVELPQPKKKKKKRKLL